MNSKAGSPESIDMLSLIEKHQPEIYRPSFPGLLRKQNRVLRMLLGLMQHPIHIIHLADQVTVQKQLPLEAKLNRRLFGNRRTGQQ